jgi:hypothetical protein
MVVDCNNSPKHAFSHSANTYKFGNILRIVSSTLSTLAETRIQSVVTQSSTRSSSLLAGLRQLRRAGTMVLAPRLG